MTTAVVTGANGFVGRHLCLQLADRGWDVRVITRGAAPDGTRRLGASLAGDAEALTQSVAGADVVYHLAGIAHEGVAEADADALTRVNVDASVRLLKCADRAGVAQMVWLSSIKVLGDVSERPLRPGDPYRPGDAYARSKVRAEQALQDTPARSTRLAVVRPPLVYGPGVGGNFQRLLRWVARGWPLPLGRALQPRSMVGVANLCDLLARLADPRGGIFHVADPEDLSVAELVRRLSAALGRPARLWSVPPQLLATAARWGGRRAVYSRLFDALQVDQRDTARALGWCPPRSVDSQLQETVTWYQQRP